jgi:hypothetical protein
MPPFLLELSSYFFIATYHANAKNGVVCFFSIGKIFSFHQAASIWFGLCLSASEVGESALSSTSTSTFFCRV